MAGGVEAGSTGTAGGTVTRFAPSPTGLLHLGHAYAALFAERAARAGRGHFLLRIEDIDRTRCRPAFEAAILEDLAWLGVRWDGPVVRQSDRLALYAAQAARLEALGVAYPCFCTRRDIAQAATAPHGPEGPVYPGTCRGTSAAERARRLAAGEVPAIRLDARRAAAITGPLTWHDRDAGTTAVDPGLLGDVVVARKDIGTSYHLAVVTDDAAQGVTLVTRGVDLAPATHVHRLLQALLGMPAPDYHHHELVVDATGSRLAKRSDAATLASLREAGETPTNVRVRLGLG